MGWLIENFGLLYFSDICESSAKNASFYNILQLPIFGRLFYGFTDGTLKPWQPGFHFQYNALCLILQ